MIALVPHTEDSTFTSDYRTEDVRFSPSGRRLAVVATNGRLLLFTVDITVKPIKVTLEVDLYSSFLMVPHGVEFLNENVIVVANRNGKLVFFNIHKTTAWKKSEEIEPFQVISSSLFGEPGKTRKLRERDLFCGPGSVRAFGGNLYVTCNYMNTVSTYSYHFDRDVLHIKEGSVIAHEGLSVVDGIAISLDGSLMALSDHDHHRVAIYRRDDNNKNHESECEKHNEFKPACSLFDIDMHFPHGLRFDNKGERLFAVDAGGRFIHVFETTSNWHSDMFHSSLKTFGIELDAFNKSRDAVSDEFRLLEGGGKGLDIDPSGQILVVTCRNQSLRFFEIEPKKQTIQEVLNQRDPTCDDDNTIALSCLIDDVNSIWVSVHAWLATAINLAKVSPKHIHIHHVCELTPKLMQLCKKIGVNTHYVSRFDSRNAYSNKIIQGETQFGNVKSVVLTDVDVVFTDTPPFQNLTGFVAGKLVDMENPPLEILQNIFHNAGVSIIGIASNEYTRNNFYKIFETIIGNFNGGFYSIPNYYLVPISQRWGVWSKWLLERSEIMQKWSKHSDQIAFCLAVNELKIPIKILNNSWNYPLHLNLPTNLKEPWIIHHHAALDSEMLLLPAEDSTLEISIKRVNAAINSFKIQYDL